MHGYGRLTGNHSGLLRPAPAPPPWHGRGERANDQGSGACVVRLKPGRLASGRGMGVEENVICAGIIQMITVIIIIITIGHS